MNEKTIAFNAPSFVSTTTRPSLVLSLPDPAPPSKSIQELMTLAQTPVPKVRPSSSAFDSLNEKHERNQRLCQTMDVCLVVFGAFVVAPSLVALLSFLASSSVNGVMLGGICLFSLATWITYRLKKHLSRQDKKLSILKKRALRLAPQNPSQENFVRNQLIQLSGHSQCPAYLQKTLSSLYFSAENSKFPQKHWEKVSNLLNQISKDFKEKDMRNKFNP